MAIDDGQFAELIAERTAAIPGVLAVTLGGSRAQGGHRPDSDWDFGLYYRRRLDPDDVRALGWPGTVFAPGEWGGGVMNGGAWLTIDGRRVDLIYRDLDEVEHHVAEAEQGRFEVEQLPFYLAGIPTYVVVGELAIARVLVGALPRPGFPTVLRERAARYWSAAARLSLGYAEDVYAARGDALGCAGTLARAVVEAAHGRLAARGEWALNEKHVVARAGLDGLIPLFARLGSTPEALRGAVEEVRAALVERYG
ncbi:MAG TPA: nucleotidyltransferase domain-containing protein [Actinomycetes bacterium]